jgi:hypothetical protein
MALSETVKLVSSLLVLIGCIALFGVMYGVLLNNQNADNQINNVTNFNTIFGVNAVLIVLLGLLAFYFVKSDPSMFQPYVLVVLHLALLMSSLSLSYSVITVTSS